MSKDMFMVEMWVDIKLMVPVGSSAEAIDKEVKTRLKSAGFGFRGYVPDMSKCYQVTVEKPTTKPKKPRKQKHESNS